MTSFFSRLRKGLFPRLRDSIDTLEVPVDEGMIEGSFVIFVSEVDVVEIWYCDMEIAKQYVGLAVELSRETAPKSRDVGEWNDFFLWANENIPHQDSEWIKVSIPSIVRKRRQFRARYNLEKGNVIFGFLEWYLRKIISSQEIFVVPHYEKYCATL